METSPSALEFYTNHVVSGEQDIHINSNWSDKDEHSHKSAYVHEEKLAGERVPMAINSQGKCR